jgi:dCMP deaminase
VKNIINEKGYDEFGRPCRDLYIMNLCFNVSMKSLDPDTKHGCVVIDREGGILTTGYNGPPRGCVDLNVPLTRPDKYDWMLHSEANCIFTAARNGIPLRGSHFYITGIPCFHCLTFMIQVGASRITYGPLNSWMHKEEGYFDKYKVLFSILQTKIMLEKFKYTKGLLEMTPRTGSIIKDRPVIDFNIK